MQNLILTSIIKKQFHNNKQEEEKNLNNIVQTTV